MKDWQGEFEERESAAVALVVLAILSLAAICVGAAWALDIFQLW